MHMSAWMWMCMPENSPPPPVAHGNDLRLMGNTREVTKLKLTDAVYGIHHSISKGQLDMHRAPRTASKGAAPTQKTHSVPNRITSISTPGCLFFLPDC